MADINTIPRRFEKGGTLTINDGTTTNTIKNMEPGTLEYHHPSPAPLEYADRDVPQRPLQGPQTRPYLKFQIKAGAADSETLAAIFITPTPVATDDGQVPEFAITMQIPDDAGDSTGWTIPITDAYTMTRPVYRAGVEFDIWEFEFGGTDVPAVARY